MAPGNFRFPPVKGGTALFLTGPLCHPPPWILHCAPDVWRLGFHHRTATAGKATATPNSCSREPSGTFPWLPAGQNLNTQVTEKTPQ